MIRKVKFDQQQQKNQGNCKTNAFILNDMTEPETESRWNRAKNKMFVPENLDVCREDFLASTTLISPIFTYVLLVYISGIPLLKARGKEKWGHLSQYQEYIDRTPTLFFNPLKSFDK